MPRDLYLSQLADFSEAVGSATLLSPSVGPAGQAIFLVADENEAQVLQGRDVQPGWASFPHSRAQRSAEIVVHNGRRVVRRIAARELPLWHPLLQPLPGDEAVVVSARCRRFRDGSAEQNARVYSAEGNLLREFILGDGIQDLQATSRGQIWVSYFDEGVFGSYGWNDPIGAPGLIRFDTTGAKEWEYEPPVGFKWIADCYALNVADNAVWGVVSLGLHRNLLRRFGLAGGLRRQDRG